MLQRIDRRELSLQRTVKQGSIDRRPIDVPSF